MTWTYSGDPSTSPADNARFLLGDTIEQDPELTDEEVAFLLADEGNDPRRAAARGAEALAAKYARLVDKSVGTFSLSASQKSIAFGKLATKLWAASAGASVAPWAGGINTDDKEARRQDPTRVKPFFSRDMMAYPTLGYPDEDLRSPSS